MEIAGERDARPGGHAPTATKAYADVVTNNRPGRNKSANERHENSRDYKRSGEAMLVSL